MLARIRAVSAAARESGALQSIETEEALARGGVCADAPFLVRRVSSLRRKDAAATAPAGPRPRGAVNPFLPYDQALHVMSLPPRHELLLNKFNVVEDHVLVVTAAFEPQSDLLTAADFSATWAVLREVAGLAFYNAGATAGASQPHKHLQVVPTPLAPALGCGAPVEPLLALSSAEAAASAGSGAAGYTSPHLPFLHALHALPPGLAALPPDAAAAKTMRRYTSALAGLRAVLALRPGGAGADSPGGAPPPDGRPFEYNLLLTREWLLVVPRARECARVAGADVSVNALGFAGSLFVRDEDQMRAVMTDPMAVLTGVTFPVAG